MLLLLTGLSPAFAATLTVGPTETYTTIQSAINAANDGDSIAVAAGTYAEAINFSGKALTIEGTDGSDTTFLDAGNNAGFAVTVSAGEPAGTTLRGITIRNGTSYGVYVASSAITFDDVVFDALGSTGITGPGIYAYYAEIDITNSAFVGITSYYGALFATASTVAIADTVFSDNYGYYGAAILGTTSSEIVMTNTIVDRNENYYSGAVYISASSSLTATDSDFTNNISTYGNGTAIQAYSYSSITLNGGSVSDNVMTYYTTQGYFGAAYAEVGSELIASGVNFSGNQVYGGAAGVASSSDGTFDACTFVDNELGYYGALMGYSAVTVSVTNSTFTGNRSGGTGGALYCGTTCELSISASTFDDNAAGASGGAIQAISYVDMDLSDSQFSGNTAPSGGAIAINSPSGSVLITNVEFNANTAPTGYGGAISAYGPQDTHIVSTTFAGNSANVGGAIYSSYTLANMLVDDSTFTANEATTGGGGAIYLYYLTGIEVATSQFNANVAYSDGGGIYGYYDVEPIHVSDSTFDTNTAAHGSGGALFGYYTIYFELFDSSFSGNSAYNSGGAYYGAYDVYLQGSGLNFSTNSADHGNGGAIYQDGLYAGYGDTELLDSTFSGNYAALSGGGLLVQYQDTAVLDGLSIEANAVDRNYGGGLYLAANNELALSHSNLCGNTADEGAGIYLASTVTSSVLNNNVIQENVATYGAGISMVSEISTSVVNNTFVGNDAAKDGAAINMYTVSGEFTNNTISHSVDGDGIVVDDASTPTTTAFTYNNFYDNNSADASGYVTPADLAAWAGNQFADPEFYAYSADGNCGNDVLLLNGGSPLINTGDPARLDPDGSTSDIGAYGGEAAEITDVDGDGAATAIDCDDDDASVYPGAIEVLDDGIDQDCDGSDLTAANADADGDGHDAPAAGGDDCNDNDASVNPSATEVWYDGIDQNCDGNDDDQDVDGVAVATDCDDTNGAAFPGNTEIWYDGIDGDCDGGNDYDQDADGFEFDGNGGDDCADEDPTVNPAAEEVWYDGTDSDCSGGSDNDQDGDGADAASTGGDDCDDTDPAKVTLDDCGIGAIDTGDTEDTDGTSTDDKSADSGGVDASSADCGCDAGAGGALAIPVVLAAISLVRRRKVARQ